MSKTNTQNRNIPALNQYPETYSCNIHRILNIISKYACIKTKSKLINELHLNHFLLYMQMTMSSCKVKIEFSPISAGHVGEPGPGDITILSNAFSLYKYRTTSSHVHSSFRTTTGGTGTISQHKDVKITCVLHNYSFMTSKFHILSRIDEFNEALMYNNHIYNYILPSL